MIRSENESLPTDYPDTPSGLSDEAGALDAAALWQRIEAWIAYRWGERSVTWIIEGSGTWVPRLKPATVESAEVWRDDDWQTVSLTQGPLGYRLDGSIYRVTATVGSADTPPAAVQEAFRRLAEYLADTAYIGRVATSGTRQLSDMQINTQRPAAWQAKALQYSGAADLLRPWRY